MATRWVGRLREIGYQSLGSLEKIRAGRETGNTHIFFLPHEQVILLYILAPFDLGTPS